MALEECSCWRVRDSNNSSTDGIKGLDGFLLAWWAADGAHLVVWLWLLPLQECSLGQANVGRLSLSEDSCFAKVRSLGAMLARLAVSLT